MYAILYVVSSRFISPCCAETQYNSDLLKALPLCPGDKVPDPSNPPSHRHQAQCLLIPVEPATSESRTQKNPFFSSQTFIPSGNKTCWSQPPIPRIFPSFGVLKSLSSSAPTHSLSLRVQPSTWSLRCAGSLYPVLPCAQIFFKLLLFQSPQNRSDRNSSVTSEKNRRPPCTALRQ